MHSSHEFSPSRKEMRSSSRATTATLPAINKKALLNDTFSIPLKKNTALTPLSNAPKTPKINNFLASSSEQGGPLSLTFGSLELAITGGLHEDDSEGMNISHFVKTPEHKRCVQMLTEGFVESFVDFFYLTHKKETSNDEEDQIESDSLNKTGSISLHDMPNDVLDSLMERLCEAEDAQREGDATGVVKAYKALATYFEQRKEYTTAVHFHQKGLEASFRLGDSTHAADAYKCIGVDYEAVGDTPLAIQYFDKYSDLVQQDPSNKDAIASSFRHLVTAYRMFAEQLEEKANLDGSQETLLSAVEYYKKCLAMAKNCADTAAEGTVNYRLGLVYKQLDKVELSVKHLQNYLYLCRLNGNSEGESAACSALADAYMSSNDILQSVKYLEENISLAQRTNQPTSQAHACRDLGVIYEQQEDYEKALEYFEKYYSLAVASQDRRLVDNARVYLGIARGNIKLMQMFNIPNHSITPATMKPLPPRTGSSAGARPHTNQSLRGSLEQKSLSSSLSSASHSSSLASSSSSSSSTKEKERKTPERVQTPNSATPRSTTHANASNKEGVVDDDAINAGLEMIRTPRTQYAETDADADAGADVSAENPPRNAVDIPPINMQAMHSHNNSHSARVREDDHAEHAASPAHSQRNDAEDNIAHAEHASPAQSHRSDARPRTAHAPRSARSDSARRPHTSASSARKAESVVSRDGTPRRPRTPSSEEVESKSSRRSEADAPRVRTPTSSRKPDTEEKEVLSQSARNRDNAEDGIIARKGDTTDEGRVRTPTSSRKGDVEESAKRDKEESVTTRVRTPTSSRKGREIGEHEERIRTPPSSGRKEEAKEREERIHTPGSTRKEETKEKEERVRTPPSSRRRETSENLVRARTPTTPNKGENNNNEINLMRLQTPTSRTLGREAERKGHVSEREGETREREEINTIEQDDNMINNGQDEERADSGNIGIANAREVKVDKKICEEEG